MIKHELTSASVLITQDLSKPFRVQTDASDIGLGAVLTQNIDGVEHVIAYSSHLLQGAEKWFFSVSRERVLRGDIAIQDLIWKDDLSRCSNLDI